MAASNFNPSILKAPELGNVPLTISQDRSVEQTHDAEVLQILSQKKPNPYGVNRADEASNDFVEVGPPAPMGFNRSHQTWDPQSAPPLPPPPPPPIFLDNGDPVPLESSSESGSDSDSNSDSDSDSDTGSSSRERHFHNKA